MTTTNQPTRILRLPEVKDRTGLSRSMIYLMMKESRFPQAITVSGTRCVGWIESEIDTWVADKIEIGRKAHIAA
jgi:prophage regulatory protein